MGWWVAVVGRAGWLPWYLWRRERAASSAHPPSPARGRPQATYVPTCRQFNKKTFGRSEGSSICALVCAAVRDRMCFKGLGRSDGGKGGWPYYDLPNSIGTSLQNIWLWKTPGGDLKSERETTLVIRRSLCELKQELELIQLGSWGTAIAQLILFWALQCSPMVLCSNHPESCFEIVWPGHMICDNYPESWHQLFLDNVILDNRSTRSLNQPSYVTRYLEMHKSYMNLSKLCSRIHFLFCLSCNDYPGSSIVAQTNI